MNNEFMALREAARLNRDRAIATIRKDYETALAKINELQQELTGQSMQKQTRAGAAIEAAIPVDEDFSITDIITKLEDTQPKRAWTKRTVDTHIHRLRELGLIRRVRRARSNEPAMYARVEAPPRGKQADDTSLMQAIGQALTRPMNTAEVSVAVLESGYQTRMSKSNFRYAVAKALKRAGFTRKGGKWLP